MKNSLVSYKSVFIKLKEIYEFVYKMDKLFEHFAAEKLLSMAVENEKKQQYLEYLKTNEYQLQSEKNEKEQIRKQLFDESLAAEKRRSMEAEAKANERIRKLQADKSLQADAANKFETDKIIIEINLKAEQKRFQELKEANELERAELVKSQAQSQSFEYDLETEKQRAMTAENKANLEIKRLENLKLLQLCAASTTKIEKSFFEIQLKAEQQKVQDLIKANEFEKLEAERFQAQKESFELNMDAEKKRAIAVENEANERIRILEIEVSIQNDEAKNIEIEKNKIEMQLQAEKQRFEDFERATLLQKNRAEKLQAQAQLYEKKLAAEKMRSHEAEAEAIEKIRKLENETSLQGLEGKMKEEEKKRIEIQLEAEKKLFEELLKRKQY